MVVVFAWIRSPGQMMAYLPTHAPPAPLVERLPDLPNLPNFPGRARSDRRHLPGPRINPEAPDVQDPPRVPSDPPVRRLPPGSHPLPTVASPDNGPAG
jgi:hypothetical protein